jgi:pimeloyl-ACP methyl ester carboxylesterase
MELTTVTLDNAEFVVRAGGQPTNTAVMIISPADQSPADYDAVAERLHNSGLSTWVLPASPKLDARAVVGVLDVLKLKWTHLVGVGEGAPIAWDVAANYFGRAGSLTVVDSAHPAALDPGALAGCPAVEVATTVVVTDPNVAAAANASGRYVHSDFRVVQLDNVSSVAKDAPASLAIEVVLRTSAW